MIDMTEVRWKLLNPEARDKSIRGHIVNAHLQIVTITKGIPNFDLEMCSCFGIKVDWVVKKIIERLAWGEDEFN